MKFRTNEIPSKHIDIDYLRGRLDGMSLLEGLGIDFSHTNGKWLMCHCPDFFGNHKNGDANPSFGFNPDELKYNCFVCGMGDAVDLVQATTGGTEQEAVALLESHSDLNPSSADDLVAKVQKIMHGEENPDVMPEYPESSIFPFRKIHPYLYERGLTKDIIVEMQVGYDEEHCGITIPHSFMGRLRGWQTRHLAMDDEGNYLCDVESCNHDKNGKPKKVPKYKNTTNLPKINTLYGYDRMKEKLTEDFVIVVESPFTALWLMSHGFDNVVATFGAFSAEQGMLLIPVPKIYFWPDNDSAGYENAKRCIESNSKYNSVYIVPAVPGEKSDAANLKDREEVLDYLSKAYHSALFKVRSPGGLYEFG